LSPPTGSPRTDITSWTGDVNFTSGVAAGFTNTVQNTNNITTTQASVTITDVLTPSGAGGSKVSGTLNYSVASCPGHITISVDGVNQLQKTVIGPVANRTTSITDTGTFTSPQVTFKMYCEFGGNNAVTMLNRTAKNIGQGNGPATATLTASRNKVTTVS